MKLFCEVRDNRVREVGGSALFFMDVLSVCASAGGGASLWPAMFLVCFSLFLGTDLAIAGAAVLKAVGQQKAQ